MLINNSFLKNQYSIRKRKLKMALIMYDFCNFIYYSIIIPWCYNHTPEQIEMTEMRSPSGLICKQPTYSYVSIPPEKDEWDYMDDLIEIFDN